MKIYGIYVYGYLDTTFYTSYKQATEVAAKMTKDEELDEEEQFEVEELKLVTPSKSVCRRLSSQLGR